MIYYFNTKTKRTNKQKEGYEAKMWKEGWIQCDPLAGTRYYTILKRMAPQYKEKDFFNFAEDFKHFIVAVQESESFGFGKDDIVYGIPYTNMNDYNLWDSRWINFPKHVFSKMKTVMTPEKENEINFSSVVLPHTLEKLKSIIEKISNPDSEIKKVADRFYDLQKYKTDQNEALEKIIKTATQWGVYSLKENETNLSEIWEQAEEKYPLLNAYNYKRMLNYIRLVDISRSAPERAHELLNEYLVDKIADRLNPPEEE